MGSTELILHVENDPDDVFLLKRAFTKAGITREMRSAESGQAAVEYLNGSNAYGNRDAYPLPTVILLDWNMPLMSGAEFLRWIRHDAKWKRLPVVVLTSSASEHDMQEAYDLGANGYLVKPSAQEAFISMVRGFAQFWLDWNRSEYRHMVGP